MNRATGREAPLITEARREVEEIIRLIETLDEAPWSLGMTVRDSDLRDGYALWAGSYDSVPNPLIVAEQPVVRSLLEEEPLGRALDAAAGTGRHAVWLHERGHHVVALDLSEEMLRTGSGEGRCAPCGGSRSDMVGSPGAGCDGAVDAC